MPELRERDIRHPDARNQWRSKTLNSFKSASGLVQSNALRDFPGAELRASILDCGGSPPLLPGSQKNLRRQTSIAGTVMSSARTNRDVERIQRVRDTLDQNSFDALVCSLPMNVLLLTGYWPVMGASLALITREGKVAAIVPEDEQCLAEAGWSDALYTFSPMSLRKIQSPIEAVSGTLAKAMAEFRLRAGQTVGFEGQATHLPASYVSVELYGANVTRLIEISCPGVKLVSATEPLENLRSTLTSAEVEPGVKGQDVDRAARETLRKHGFQKEFKHPTGHGTGFTAVDHHSKPRLHPVSDDVLEPGMVFNLEPGVYLEGYGGVRHCDMVAVTSNGAELLTPFQTEIRDLTLAD